MGDLHGWITCGSVSGRDDGLDAKTEVILSRFITTTPDILNLTMPYLCVLVKCTKKHWVDGNMQLCEWIDKRGMQQRPVC